MKQQLLRFSGEGSTKGTVEGINCDWECILYLDECIACELDENRERERANERKEEVERAGEFRLLEFISRVLEAQFRSTFLAFKS